MSYFKIEKSGCTVTKGLVQIRYDLYLKSLPQVPLMPDGGYLGKCNDDGMPIDESDFNAWLASLPLVDNYITRFAYFEPGMLPMNGKDLTEYSKQAICYVGELKLILTEQGFQSDEIIKIPKTAKEEKIFKLKLTAGNNIPFAWNPVLAEQSEKVINAVMLADFLAYKNIFRVL